MDERVYAFTDEYGNFGWDLSNPDVSSFFIVTAIIVKEADLELLREKAEEIRRKHFQTGEMKSSTLARNHDRRKKILAELLPLSFTIFSVVFDKKKSQEMLDAPGLQYKQPFYKFLNNLVHKELRQVFKRLTVVADEIGGSDYMQSFCRYVEAKQDIPNLFGEAEFMFQNSKTDVILQIADIIGGALGHQLDPHKNDGQVPDYRKMLDKKFTRIEYYPKSYDSYTLDNSAIATDYDKPIAELCFRQAVAYVEKADDADDLETAARLVIVKYLLFRFMNNDLRDYISTKELKSQLAYKGFGEMSTHMFRARVIAKLRDEGIIIASSKNGYKLPTSEKEVYDFINHGASIINPMLGRLRRCRDIIKLGTVNELDVFDHTEYSTLKKYFDIE